MHDNQQSSPDDQPRTPVDIIGDDLATLEALELKRSNDRGPRDQAVSNIRTQAATLSRRARAAEANAAESDRMASRLSTQTMDTSLVARVTVQVAYLLRTDETLEFYPEMIGDTTGERRYGIYGGSFNGTVIIAGDNGYSLSTWNDAAGIRQQTLPLAYRGLTASAALQLASIYGIRLTRQNTPSHLRDELWDPEPDMPEGLEDVLGGLLGSGVRVRAFRMPGSDPASFWP